MSTDISPEKPSKDKSHKKQKLKDKDRSEKKSSKKRRHEEEPDAPDNGELVAQASPIKKRRKERDAVSSQVDEAVPASQSKDKQKATSKTSSSVTSPFCLQRTSLYLPVAPISFHDTIAGVCAEHLSPLLLTYYPPVSGVVLSYSDVSLSESPAGSSSPGEPVLAHAVDEYAAPFVWATATFLVFRPQKGVQLTGYVNLQTESHLGLVCYNFFSVSIPKDRLPSTWSWIWDNEGEDSNTDANSNAGKGRRKNDAGGQGHWVDEDGAPIPEELTFRILSYESSPWSESEKTVISIRGSLLDEAGDKAVDEERRQLREKRKAAKDGARQRGGTPGPSNSAVNGASRR